MSYLRFAKMHGAGNDFIVVDQASAAAELSPECIRILCDRKRGIGGDGLILLSRSGIPHQENLLRMDFYNCDGSRASLCGNGLRCAAAFAYNRTLVHDPEILFLTGSGVLRTHVLPDARVRTELPVEAAGFRTVSGLCGYTAEYGTVGVPHAVVFVKDVEKLDVEATGRMLRNHDAFQPDGVNVDFLPLEYDATKPLAIRTYERGVEAETLACGTGAGAAALVLAKRHPGQNKFLFLTQSGDILEAEIPNDWMNTRKMYLTGPAVESFHGATDTFHLE